MKKKSFREEAKKINYVEVFCYSTRNQWLKQLADRIQKELTDSQGKFLGEAVLILHTQFAYLMRNELEEEGFNPETEVLMFTDREAVIVNEDAKAIRVKFTLDRKSGFIYKQRNLAFYLDEELETTNPFITVEGSIKWANVAIIEKEVLMDYKKSKQLRVSPILSQLINKIN